MGQLRFNLIITAVILASFMVLPVIGGKSDLPDNWQNLADSLGKEKKYNETIDMYDQAVRAFPDNDVPSRQKGMFLARIGQYTDALEAFENTRKINADNPLTWQNIGAVNVQLGRYDDAIESFNKVLSMDAKWMDPYRDIGIVLDKQKKHKEAIEMFDKALSEDPNDYETYALKANTYVHLGEDEKALETYKEGLSVLQKTGYREKNEYVDDSWGDNEVSIIAGGGGAL